MDKLSEARMTDKFVKYGLVMILALAGCHSGKQVNPPKPYVETSFIVAKSRECSANQWRTPLAERIDTCETLAAAFADLYINEHPELVGIAK